VRTTASRARTEVGRACTSVRGRARGWGGRTRMQGRAQTPPWGARTLEGGAHGCWGARTHAGRAHTPTGIGCACLRGGRRTHLRG
jgi:hypothetical protein